jgi:hypothetical protein
MTRGRKVRIAAGVMRIVDWKAEESPDEPTRRPLRRPKRIRRPRDRLEAGVWPIKRKQLADQIDRCERDGKPAVFLRSRIEYLDNLYGHREH